MDGQEPAESGTGTAALAEFGDLIWVIAELMRISGAIHSAADRFGNTSVRASDCGARLTLCAEHVKAFLGIIAKAQEARLVAIEDRLRRIEDRETNGARM